MKKKVLIWLTVFSVFFLLGGAYIIATIEKGTSTLDNLITLHQVEILREHLLIQIKRVQYDLKLKNTRYAKNIDAVIMNMKNLERMADTCFDCHHTKKMQERLTDLHEDISTYKTAVSRLFTIRANIDRLEIEEDRAFKQGEHLLTMVNEMISMASNKLENKTRATLRNISHTKTILFILVSLGPLSTAILAVIFLKNFTRPVNSLLTATRKIKSGEMDYRVEDLKDEFGEVATSFNEMSHSLNESMRKIEESEKRYRMLFESANDAIFMIEAEGENAGDIVSANEAAARMHGYTVDEMLGLNLIKDIDSPEAAAEAKGRIEDLLKGERIKAEITHRKKDGTVFPVEISACLLEFMDHKYILAIDRDITERKKMEHMLVQSKHDWEDTFNTITDMITIHDNDFNIIRCNKAAEKILELPFMETIQAKCYEYYHGVKVPPEWCPSCDCYKTGKPASFEIFEPHLNKFLEVRAMPRFDMHKNLVGLIHVVRDITERKHIEDALKRAEQMKMVGEWAAGLAHEIKNSLAGIKISMEIFTRVSDFPDKDRAPMQKVLDEIKRIESLLKSLLNFAKPPKLQLLRTDINEILDNAIGFSLMDSSSRSGTAGKVNIQKEYDSNIPATLADRLQLRQVFMNLLINAGDAVDGEGTITVRTSFHQEADTITIEISDTGKGIPENRIREIFRPFYTTKTKGTGLGLAISRRIIEEHGGTIHAENRPEGGVRFRIDIPVKTEKERIT